MSLGPPTANQNCSPFGSAKVRGYFSCREECVVAPPALVGLRCIPRARIFLGTCINPGNVRGRGGGVVRACLLFFIC